MPPPHWALHAMPTTRSDNGNDLQQWQQPTRLLAGLAVLMDSSLLLARSMLLQMLPGGHGPVSPE